MTGHKERCKSIFKERILPHFPQAKERFDSFFSDSYELIRMLPEIPAPGLRRYHPYAKKDSEGCYSVRYFGIEMGLTALGLKPVALPGCILTNPLLELFGTPAGRSALIRAGLGIRYNNRGIEFYDPISAAPILSSILNHNVAPEGVEENLQELESLKLPLYSAELLGYPDNTAPSDSWKVLRVGSSGFISYPDIFYLSHLACGISAPEAVLPTLAARAAAVASIEEIRETPLGIESASSIVYKEPGGKDSYRKKVIVARGSIPGDWTITET